ncbi:hypothetical protein [Brevundimonas sp. Root1423]|uniref:hypothetical protein n=1 Tax=Brevundimonas sp. Root1423 TaxID=1736462 RepID=UPI0012E36F7D|nr:hypothetical protein [Brevundimonas sp. Root1423]
MLAFRASSAATKRATSPGAPSTSSVWVEDGDEHPTRASAANATLNNFITLNLREPKA